MKNSFKSGPLSQIKNRLKARCSFASPNSHSIQMIFSLCTLLSVASVMSTPPASIAKTVASIVHPWPKCIIQTNTLLHPGKFVELRKLTYLDPKSVSRPWEVAQRTNRSGKVDAVSVIPILKGDGNAKTVIITQYRPPVDAIVVEFPAGLVDPGFTEEETAVKELKEETGYVGIARSSSGVLVADPGMTSASMMSVVVDVDMSHEENRHPIAKPEDGEYIAKHVVELDQLHHVLVELQKREGYVIDMKLMHFAEGLSFKV